MTRGAALPILEALRAIVKEHFATQFRIGLQVRQRGTIERNNLGAHHTAFLKGNFHQRIREVADRVDAIFGGHHATRTIGVKGITATDARQEGEVIVHLLCREGHFSHLATRRSGIQTAMHCGAINHAHLTRTGVRHHDRLVIRCHSDAPRIGGTQVNIIQKHGVDVSTRHTIEDRKSGRIHPTTLQLRRGELITCLRMGHIDVQPIRRSGNATHARRTIRQGQVRLHLEGLGINHRHLCRHRLNGFGRIVRQHVNHKEELAILTQGATMRFAKALSRLHQLERLGIVLLNIGIKTVTEIDPTAIRRHNRRHRTVTRHHRFAIFTEETAFIAILRRIENGAIGCHTSARHREPHRFSGHPQETRPLLRRGDRTLHCAIQATHCHTASALFSNHQPLCIGRQTNCFGGKIGCVSRNNERT